jgi:hypothetical protein
LSKMTSCKAASICIWLTIRLFGPSRVNSVTHEPIKQEKTDLGRSLAPACRPGPTATAWPDSGPVRRQHKPRNNTQTSHRYAAIGGSFTTVSSGGRFQMEYVSIFDASEPKTRGIETLHGKKGSAVSPPVPRAHRRASGALEKRNDRQVRLRPCLRKRVARRHRRLLGLAMNWMHQQRSRSRARTTAHMHGYSSRLRYLHAKPDG